MATVIPQQNEEIAVEKKIFDADKLRSYLQPVCEKLYKLDEAIPFRIPVDPEALRVPDYFDIVKQPMDLGTISQKLSTGKYKNPWEFCDDVWLMFENAWLYNRKNSKVYKWCSELSKIFINEINPVMKKIGYCCGQKLSFTPLTLFCNGRSACVIARDQAYHLYVSTQCGVSFAERYIYCQKCFDKLPEEGISLGENVKGSSNMAPRSKFTLLKNDHVDWEPFETCKVCQRRWHRICANYSKKVYPEGFICDTCRTEKNKPKPENKYTAKKLPHCHLSRHIEDGVNEFIEEQGSQGARQSHEVVIRVLSSVVKEVELKLQTEQKNAPEGFPEKLPYRTKAIFAFEVIDGVEVYFFGLHVQEYGSSILPPNMRRIYIAYLDSVKLFQREQLRMDVCNEIVVRYLDYMNKLGFTIAHILYGPSSKDEDYDLNTPMWLPYLASDLWPNVVEDCIRDAENKENERKKHEETFVDEDEYVFLQCDDQGAENDESSDTKKETDLNLNNSSHKSKDEGDGGTEKQGDNKLFCILKKHKEFFFTICLLPQETESTVSSNEISDPDSTFSSELTNIRDRILTKAREEHWEFSTMRRAKWSTMNFCYALHSQEQDHEYKNYTCDICTNNASYQCPTCGDFYLCEACQQKAPHIHLMINKLVEVEPKLNESSSNIRNESVKKIINFLVHACQCRDANCDRLNCHKMKKVVAHTKICKKRQISSNSCPVCTQLIAICCYHAKHCSLDVCPVPFCCNVRRKLQEQKASHNRQANVIISGQMEKSKIAELNESVSKFSLHANREQSLTQHQQFPPHVSQKTGVDNLQMHSDAGEDKMYDWQQQRNAFLSKIAQHFGYSEQNMVDTSQIKHFSSSGLMSQQMLVQHPQPAPYQQNSQCNQRVDQQIVGLSDLQLQESVQGNRKQVMKRKVSEDEPSDEKLLSGLTTLFKTVLGSGGSQEEREEQQFGRFVASSLSNLGDDDVKNDAMVEIQQVLQTAKRKYVEINLSEISFAFLFISE